MFRRLAQEAHASGQRDGGPVIEPGQTAMHRMRDDLPDWKKIAPGCETVPFGFRTRDFLRQYQDDSSKPAVQPNWRIERNTPAT
ncbi:hypothetical protein RVY52_000696 [Burkholderia cenocepacia]|nr:hypothetical protein [Burkholderia cenocepacia]